MSQILEQNCSVRYTTLSHRSGERLILFDISKFQFNELALAKHSPNIFRSGRKQ